MPNVWADLGEPPDRNDVHAWREWHGRLDNYILDAARRGTARSLDDLGFQNAPEKGAALYGSEYGDPNWWREQARAGWEKGITDAGGTPNHMVGVPGLDLVMAFTTGSKMGDPSTWTYHKRSEPFGGRVAYNPAWKDKILAAAKQAESAGDLNPWLSPGGPDRKGGDRAGFTASGSGGGGNIQSGSWASPQGGGVNSDDFARNLKQYLSSWGQIKAEGEHNQGNNKEANTGWTGWSEPETDFDPTPANPNPEQTSTESYIPGLTPSGPGRRDKPNRWY